MLETVREVDAEALSLSPKARGKFLTAFSTATAQQLGKPIGSDAANGKTTFVTLHGVERSRGIAQELTDGACGVLRAAFGGRAQFLETLAASLLERNQ